MTVKIRNLFVYSLKDLVMQLNKFSADNECMAWKLNAKIPNNLIFLQTELFTIFDRFSYISFNFGEEILAV